MRVALTFPGCHRRGGVERIMLECANFLAHRGHDTHVFASDIDERSLDQPVTRHHVTAPSRPTLFRLASFKSRCARGLCNLSPKPDVQGAFGVISPPDGVLWVQSVHRAWIDIARRSRTFSGRLKQRLNLVHPYILRLERDYFAGRQYAKLIALTDQVKADLINYYNVPENDICIIPNGFSPTEFNLVHRNAHRQRMRAQLGYGESDKVVIFVANELHRKGFFPLARAISLLNDPSIHLLAVGNLDAGPAGAFPRVRFTGPTSNTADYYAAADVFALPTQYEAWGLVIVEAQACGLPVLTSRLAGAAITVHENHSGNRLDNPNDPEEIAHKLRPLLDGKHDSAQTISDSVASYAWSNVLLDYEKVLARCSRSYIPNPEPRILNPTP